MTQTQWLLILKVMKELLRQGVVSSNSMQLEEEIVEEIRKLRGKSPSF